MWKFFQKLKLKLKQLTKMICLWRISWAFGSFYPRDRWSKPGQNWELGAWTLRKKLKKTTLVSSGEDAKTTLVSSWEDAKTTLVPSGEDAKTTLVSSWEDAKTTLVSSGEDAKTTLVSSGEVKLNFKTAVTG